MTQKKKQHQPYTTGQLNKLIDSLIHPLIKKDPNYIIIDTILHAVVEQDPSTTMRKFIRYNLPKLLKQTEKRVPKHDEQ